jgi:hypothetical protein
MRADKRKETIMKTLMRLLLTIATVTGTAMVATPASAAVSYFRHPSNQLSRQFRDGSCIYKIIYGNFGSSPYATAHFYSGVCNSGSRQPEVYVEYQPNSGQTKSGSATGGIDGCGAYIAYSAVGPAGHIATNMWVYFPATDNWKYFGSTGNPTVPATSCP